MSAQILSGVAVLVLWVASALTAKMATGNSRTGMAVLFGLGSVLVAIWSI